MVIFSQCLDCKNFIGKKDNNTFHCKAYPDGIQEDVFWNKINHEKNIEGDNGYKFESLNESTPQQQGAFFMHKIGG